MGFGFNLIGFPILLLATVGLIIYAIAKQTWKTLLIVVVLWVLTILLFILSTIATNFRTPIRLTKTDIVGNYRIDTTFFKGKNAKWQYDHYRFTITPTDSIYFYMTHNNTILKTIKGKLKYFSGPPDLWVVQGDTSYHLIKYPPTLFRGYKKFYYVFHSDFYGNMFFRKEQIK
ncbi:MAG: hypothetical protein EOP43_06255 [Sphingobacteriaceae bacterium]|nr:MAG: hypothetical protein EOP43_06255 [Sphingobacteriaceae bacterium]